MTPGQSLLHALTPYTVGGLRLERWGSDSDGGYVVPADLMSNATVLVTGGVADDVQFEAEVALRAPGIRIGLFDHTISKAPSHAPANAVWHKLGLGSAPNCISLEAATELSGATSEDQIVIKIDIEYAEWELIESTSDDFWDRVTVLIVEMHGFDIKERWGQYAALLEKLNRHLVLIDLHGNNFSKPPYFEIESELVPSVMEGTYVNRKFVSAGQSPVVWSYGAPHPLDRSNHSAIIDLPFDFWLTKSPLKRQLERLGRMILPWRLRKNFYLNLGLKGDRKQRMSQQGTH
jgi:hypothetical protein